MLKLIRKYQLIILAIGGSLLMVVFLLQPVLTRLTPDSRNNPVARLDDGTVFDGHDTQRANFDLSVLKNTYSRTFVPLNFGGLGLDPINDRDTEFHWLLLIKAAGDAGLIGDDAEGRTWIPTIAVQEAQIVVQQEARQGDFASQEEANQRLEEVSATIENQLRRNIRLGASRMRGMTEDEVYRTLAKARGVQRLMARFITAPSMSDLGALSAAVERLDAIAVNAAVVPGSALAPLVEDPSESELAAFFERFKDASPSESEFGIGYTQPTRVKLGWLTLNRGLIEASIEIDRIELRKIWRRDAELPPDDRQYPGDFAGERPEIERAYRADLAEDIMVEADRIIRAEVLKATSALREEDGVYVLPEDWASRRPELDAIAEAVVVGVEEQLGASIPTPSVTIRSDQWLTNRDISTIPGLGQASYRVGSQRIPTFNIPSALEDEESIELLGMQAGVPQADPAAQDQQGNRYYVLVYEARPAGASLSIDDAGRERVIDDYKTLGGYERLVSRLDTARSSIESTGDLTGALDELLRGVDGETRPRVVENVMVYSDRVTGPPGTQPDPALNTQAFIDAVREKASPLDPLATPEQLAQDPIGVGVGVPSRRAVALSRIVAPRPLTSDLYRARMTQILNQVRVNEMREVMAEDGLPQPFSYEAMRKRYGLESLESRDGEPRDDADDEDAQDEDADDEAAGDEAPQADASP